MNHIGEVLANLRKARGMTQEALADVIGVSVQTISKWENHVNMPDIMLLPVIADFFHVSIDTLFGRNRLENNAGDPEQVFDSCCSSVLEQIVLSCYRPETGKPFEKLLEECTKEIKGNEKIRSGVIRKHGVVYYREKLGGLLLKRPVDGWSSLFDKKELFDIFERLCNPDFCAAMSTIIKENLSVFTVSSLCNSCKAEAPDLLEDNLKKSGVFCTKELEVEGKKVTIYELCQTQKLFLYFAILSYASELTEYKDHYCCYHGEGNFFSE